MNKFSYKNYTQDICAYLDTIDLISVQAMVDSIDAARRRGSSLLFAGNGGSAATANHFACDISKNVRFSGQPQLRALSLSSSPEHITAYGNDVEFSQIFSRQLAILAKEDDVLFAISASGNSPNIVAAVNLAKDMGITVITLSGFDGGQIAPLSDINITVSLDSYEQIEDAHTIILHMIVSSLKDRIQATAE